jgi:hydroxyacylglutathione hydrolase
MRCAEPSVAAAAECRAGHPLAGPVEVFAALRSWKDRW